MKKPYCRNCKFFEPSSGDEKPHCSFRHIEVDQDARPHDFVSDPSCWMRGERRHKTPAEVSLQRSIAGRKGGLARRGTGKGPIPRMQMSIRHYDHDVLIAYAQKHNKSLSDAIHAIAAQLIRNNPALKPKSWPESE